MRCFLFAIYSSGAPVVSEEDHFHPSRTGPTSRPDRFLYSHKKPEQSGRDTAQAFQMASCISDYIGDGYCDSDNNLGACSWDGGDCCFETCVDSYYYYCSDNPEEFSECSDPDYAAPSCDENAQANGNCDQSNNKEACSWDGGDCCFDTCTNETCSTVAEEFVSCLDPRYASCFPSASELPKSSWSPEEPCFDVGAAEASQNFGDTEQRRALDALFQSAGGVSWYRTDHWKDSQAHICRRYGVFCNSSGLVIALDLTQNNLRGSISSDIGVLGSSVMSILFCCSESWFSSSQTRRHALYTNHG